MSFAISLSPYLLHIVMKVVEFIVLFGIAIALAGLVFLGGYAYHQDGGRLPCDKKAEKAKTKD